MTGSDDGTLFFFAVRPPEGARKGPIGLRGGHGQRSSSPVWGTVVSGQAEARA